jgi:hypothetical protein
MYPVAESSRFLKMESHADKLSDRQQKEVFGYAENRRTVRRSAFEIFGRNDLEFYDRDTNGMLNGDGNDVLRELQRGCLK